MIRPYTAIYIEYLGGRSTTGHRIRVVNGYAHACRYAPICIECMPIWLHTGISMTMFEGTYSHIHKDCVNVLRPNFAYIVLLEQVSKLTRLPAQKIARITQILSDESYKSQESQRGRVRALNHGSTDINKNKLCITVHMLNFQILKLERLMHD
jgi:hypothetical protein